MITKSSVLLNPFPHPPSNQNAGIIVAGPPGSGKSTCIQNMVDALCVQTRAISRQSHSSKASATSESMHKLLRINPTVVDDMSLMFGSLGHNNEWVDGIITHAIRKANRVSLRTMIRNRNRNNYLYNIGFHI